jgi:hypothetical protein
MVERQEIHAVHVDDQAELLERLGLLDAFKEGALKCASCDKPVREHGLGLVKMNEAGEVEVACAAATCSKRGNGTDA